MQLKQSLLHLFFNNTVSLLSATAGKMKAGEGRSLSSQPWHYEVHNVAPCSEQLLCPGKPLKRHLRHKFASLCWMLIQIWFLQSVTENPSVDSKLGNTLGTRLRKEQEPYQRCIKYHSYYICLLHILSIYLIHCSA